jgi:hypothetical protein
MSPDSGCNYWYFYYALIPDGLSWKTVDRGLEIDKDYGTEEVTIAKRKGGKIAILIIGNLE